MKILTAFLLLMAATGYSFAGGFKSGDELLTAMRAKYDGKWYKTLTFVQTTTNFKPDGTSEAHTWYEAMSVPGDLRIDFAPAEKGDGILFADGKVFSFTDGTTKGGRPFVHPLLVLGFDVYVQPAATTIEQVKAMGIDLTQIHEAKWMGKDVYVVGAKAGDEKTPQVWVDKKTLVFVRLIQLGGRDKKSIQETQFNKYVKVKGGGWVSAEVKFFIDGKPSTTEEYTDIQTDLELSRDLWDPEKWMTAERGYWKKK